MEKSKIAAHRLVRGQKPKDTLRMDVTERTDTTDPSTRTGRSAVRQQGNVVVRPPYSVHLPSHETPAGSSRPPPTAASTSDRAIPKLRLAQERAGGPFGIGQGPTPQPVLTAPDESQPERGSGGKQDGAAARSRCAMASVADTSISGTSPKSVPP